MNDLMYHFIKYLNLRLFLITVNHCYKRPPVLTDHECSAEGPIFQYNWTCHQKPPALTDHIFVENWLVSQDRFYYTSFQVASPCITQMQIMHKGLEEYTTFY